MRGKWRPKLLDYAKNASEKAVVAATTTAFGKLKTSACPAMQDVGQALKELTNLKASSLWQLLIASCHLQAALQSLSIHQACMGRVDEDQQLQVC